MCEPVSASIACGAAACCCVVVVVALLAVATTVMGPLAQIFVEVATCANETVGREMSVVHEGHCAEVTEQGCDKEEDHHFGSVDHEKEEECRELKGKCGCEVVQRLATLESPSFQERLLPCCEKVQGGLGQNPILQAMAESGSETCHTLISNVTNHVHKAHENCQHGIYPGLEEGFVGTGGGAPGGFINKFEVSGSLAHHLGLPRSASALDLAVLSAFLVPTAAAAVTLVLLRRRRQRRVGGGGGAEGVTGAFLE